MNKHSDEVIEKDIDNYLNKEMGESAEYIKVQSRNGQVTLTGIVDVLSEKNTAGELAGKVQGVVSIENCLTVSTDGTFTDKDTEAEIMNKFDGIKELIPIGANVVRGTAILEGRVNTLKEKNLAIHQASKALGVKDIVSHIEIDSLNKIDEATINNRLQQRLVEEGLDRCHIHTEIQNGSLKLEGYVDTIHDMESALEIAEGIEGIRNVKNFLRIRR